MILTPSNLANYKDNIKCIVFDFGGVLIDLYPEHTFQAISNLVGKLFFPKQFNDFEKKLYSDYEKGLTNTENLLWYIQHISYLKPFPRDIVDAWNKMLGPMKFENLAIVEQLKKSYKTALLSNNNDLHLEHILNRLKYHHDIPDFNGTYFYKTYYSQHLHLSKPDAAIFQLVADDLGFPKESLLLIDDTMENIQAASDNGWNAIYHERNSSLDYLSALM